MGVQKGSQSSSGQQTSDSHNMGFQEAGALGLSRSGSAFINELSGLMNKGMEGYGDYSKANAISDVNGVLKNQALTAMQSAMPTIAKSNIASGAYNSTTKELLSNDFQSRLAGQLAETQLGAINTYGQLQNQRLGALSNLGQAGSTSESINMSGSMGINEALSQSQQSNKSKGSNFGLSLEDGGEVPKNPNGLDVLSTGSTKPFSLFNEFFNFDGKGGRKGTMGGLQILPGMLDLVSGNSNLVSAPNKPEAVTPEEVAAGAIAEQAKPAEAAFDNVMRYSDAMTQFAKDNKFKDVGEAIKFMNAPEHERWLPEHYEREQSFQGMDAAMKSPEMKQIMEQRAIARAEMHGAADGGQLPMNQGDTSNFLSRFFADNLFERTRQRRESEAGLTEGQVAAPGATTPGGITINVGTQQPQQQSLPEPAGMQQQQGSGFFGRLLKGALGFEDGGTITDDTNLQRAIQNYAATGTAPSLASRTNSNGKIGGPQTNSGRDNQVVAVAGGEGVIPADVMEVDGVPELLRYLIQTHHTKVK